MSGEGVAFLLRVGVMWGGVFKEKSEVVAGYTRISSQTYIHEKYPRVGYIEDIE